MLDRRSQRATETQEGRRSQKRLLFGGQPGRTYEQEELENYAKWASIPVINALTDLEHPCQALADFFTIQESFGTLEGQTLAYVGDGNNVAHSLMICGALLGVNVRVGCPVGFEPLSEVLEKARDVAVP